MREKGWSREFDDPIDLPCGRQLVTFEDAGTSPIFQRPNTPRDAGLDARRARAGRRCPPGSASWGRRTFRELNSDRKEPHQGKRKLKRDRRRRRGPRQFSNNPKLKSPYDSTDILTPFNEVDKCHGPVRSLWATKCPQRLHAGGRHGRHGP
jgi:hypothetical protein